jgi:hypothetical protein
MSSRDSPADRANISGQLQGRRISIQEKLIRLEDSSVTSHGAALPDADEDAKAKSAPTGWAKMRGSVMQSSSKALSKFLGVTDKMFRPSSGSSAAS